MVCKGLKHDTERNLNNERDVNVNSQDKSASPMVTKTNGFVKNKKSVLNSTILHLHKQNDNIRVYQTASAYSTTTKVVEDIILVSIDVTSLYKNLPQEEGMHTVCRA